MNDILVTVRLPGGMLEELKRAAETDHFIDMSEAVRSIVRKNWLIHSDPYLYEMKMLRKDIAEQVREKSQKLAEHMLIEELKKIKRGFNDEKA